MNKLEHEMINVLKTLRNDFGVIEIKCEFEAEGSRMDELMRLKDVSGRAGLPLIIKIGGVEAVTDIYNSLALGAHAIIAPMAETPFALSKFANVVKTMVPEDNRKDAEWFFNMETITAYENFDRMLEIPNFDMINGVTVGRVDLTGSMGLDRKSVDSDQILTICQNTFRKARAKKLSTGLGGAISTDSLPFVRTLISENLIDKFETRKVVFSPESAKYGEKAILKGIEFELLWLQSKRRYYSTIKAEDESRIAMIEKRLGKA